MKRKILFGLAVLLAVLLAVIVPQVLNDGTSVVVDSNFPATDIEFYGPDGKPLEIPLIPTMEELGYPQGGTFRTSVGWDE